MKKAMIAVDGWTGDQRLRDSVRLLLQIHDELMFEINANQAASVIPEIQQRMEGVWSGTVPMKVEVKQGRNWGELA